MQTFDLPPESRGEAPGRGRLVGRRVLVVGARQADYQIEDQPVGNGRAISMLLAREGAKVVAADYDKPAADGTVEVITASGGEATALIADVRDPRDIEDMVVGAREWLGGLDGVVYNVGIAGPQGIAATTPEAANAGVARRARPEGVSAPPPRKRQSSPLFEEQLQ